MKQFKRSLSLVIALALLLSMVYVGPVAHTYAASASDYIASTYASNLSVKTTQTVNLMQYPSTASTAKYTLPVDTMLTVKALHKNTSGTYWYEVLYYDMTLYIDATATTLMDHLTGDVTVADLMSPAALGINQGFPIGGTITSELNKLGTVTAAMHYSSNINEAPAISSSDTVNGYSYTLNSSTVDSNLIFSDLAAGSYTYLLTVEAISYYIDDNDQFATSTQTVVLENKPCVVTDASNPNDVIAFGIDVSVWNGDINWASVAKEVDFAILRIGYEYSLDTKFTQNASGCNANGIPFGVYIYSYAESEAEAIAEAEFVISVLKNYDVDLPVFFDIEDECQSSLGASAIQKIVRAFCETIKDAGYEPGLYTFLSWFNSYFSDSYYNSLPKWVAHIEVSKCSYTKGVTMWQYSWVGSVSGISGDVDCNYYYGEFPGANTDSSYLASCTYYPSNMDVTITEAVNVRKYPSTDYSTIDELSAGTQVHVTGVYKNTYGNYWYQVEVGGVTGYIGTGYASVVNYRYDDLAVVDPTMASNLNVGSGYYLRGTLTSQYNTIYTTHAKIYSGEDTLATPAISSKYTNNNKEYNLYRSDVCDNLIFSDLSAGYYTYELSADVRNYYVSSGTLKYETENVVVWTAPFTVGSASIDPPANVACDHNIVTDAAVAAGCTTTGLTAGSHCTKCGLVITAQTVVPATGHSYSVTSDKATCTKYELFHFTCSKCGDKYDVSADELGQWSETKPSGISDSLIESKVQYRYSDSTSSGWVVSETKSIKYVPTWASGFDTTNSAYAEYNKKSSKVTASETATEKIVINSDAKVGYLWYHWCSTTVTSSWAYETDPYHTFHVYYDTNDPSNYICDTSDYSYKTSHSSCSNATYWFPIEVYEQKYTVYKPNMVWGEWSEWSDTAVTASSTRKVETRTVYRYSGAELGEHTWNNGVVTTPATCVSSGIRTYTCTSCGATKTETISTGGHKYTAVVTAPTCTAQGYTTHTCANCGGSYVDSYVAATGHSYSSVVTAPTCTAQGYTTHTCSKCGGSYVNSYVSVAGHTWKDGVCSVCGEVCAHSNCSNGVCTVCGYVVLVPVISPSYATLSLEDEVKYNIHFTTENLDVPLTSMGLITWNTPVSNGTIDNAQYIIPGAEFKSSDSTYVVYSQGIPAKMLGDALYMKVYAQLENGTYVYSALMNYSAKKYAYNTIAREPEKTELVDLLVAMLNYGAEAQEYFNYKPYSLINAQLTDELQSRQTGYSNNLLAARVSASSSKTKYFTKSDKFDAISATMILEGAFAINYHVKPSLTPDNGMKLYYWSESKYNSVAALTLGNADGCIEMQQDGDYYSALYEGLAAKEIDDTVYAIAIYESEGIQFTTGVMSYSLAQYCRNAVTNSTIAADLCKATSLYCYYAKIYFNED